MPASNGGAELDAIVNQVVAEAHLNRSLILPEEIDYIREHLLKKPLRMIHIWALGVGVVITGEYFGWNFGLPVGGPVGVLIASLIVCVLYLAWVLTLSELSVAMPFAGGPMAYGRRASGKLLGFMMGWSMFLESLFATIGTALATGAAPLVGCSALLACSYILSNRQYSRAYLLGAISGEPHETQTPRRMTDNFAIQKHLKPAPSRVKQTRGWTPRIVAKMARMKITAIGSTSTAQRARRPC